MKNINEKSIILIITICVIIMGIVDAVISPPYAIKSVIKICLFIIAPVIYSMHNKDMSVFNIFKYNKKSIIDALILGISAFIIIFFGYLLLRNIFDLSNVTNALTKNIGVNKNNFIFVSIYISFVNSLLEEFFFRGFSFLYLKNIFSRKFAYIFSSLSFSLYHIAMMIGWFNIYIFIFIVLALFLAGILFNYIDEKQNSIYPSWVLHMFANFGINSIGILLFSTT